MRVTEAYIKAAIDGTFTVVQFDGRTRTISVDDDFIPNHKPGGVHKVERSGYALFTPEEDEKLIEMRRQGIKFEAIACELWRGLDSVKKRHKMLCVAGAVRAMT